MASSFARKSMAGSRSNSNLLAAQKREFPTNADDYELREECGRGVSATVWRAICKPLNQVVAIKLMDLENINCSLDEIVKEAATMRQLNHPNVLPLFCSFVHKQNLWMVEPYVAGGSVLNIMKYAYPEGLEEPVIATVMKEVLKGLEYMHQHGSIHRDVKAGNVLIDQNGEVLLADFGVAATLERSGSWGHVQQNRNTFVGTPCWMAPEVMEQTQGYNALADIWSFGITLLELAHGHAPFARFPPMKVLLMTIQNPPPTLESESTGKKHFSKAMRDIVAKCLVKDPTKRPTATQLLEHKFFKTAHDAGYVVRHLLANLPAVTDRVKAMRSGTGPVSAAESQQQMAQSQEAYVKGVSNWNFDVAALKAEAEKEPLELMPTVPEAGPDLGRAGGGASTSSVHAGVSSILPAGVAAGMVAGMAVAGAVAGIPKPAAPPSPSQQRPPAPDRQLLTPSKDKLPKLLPPGKPATLHKKQGRFEVYEGDAPPLSPHHNGGPLLDQILAKPPTPEHGRSASALSDMSEGPVSRQSSYGQAELVAGAADAARLEPEKLDKAKRKGRFQIVEEDTGDSARNRAVGRSASVASLNEKKDGGITSPTAPSVTILLPLLKNMMEGMAGSYERWKELTAAVQDCEKGKHSALHTLLQEVSDRRPPNKEDFDKMKVELLHTKDENTKLREKMRVLSEELDRLKRENTLISHP